MRKVILFDLDDTLAAEDSYIKSGYEAVAYYLLEKYDDAFNGDSASNIGKRLYELYLSDSKMVFNRALDERLIPYEKSDILELVEVYRNHDINADIYGYYSDVKSMLMSLKYMGCKLGIISDGYKVSQRKKVITLKADKLFDKIIITDELGRDYWKPDERSFEMMLEAFDADWNDMMYVGDNPAKDFLIGRDHEIATVRIVREKSVYADTEYLEGIKETVRISSMSELADIVKRL